MIPWVSVAKWLAIVAAVSALVWWAAVTPRLQLAAERTAHAKVLADLAQKTATAAQAVRTRETEVRDLLDASNQYREQGIADAVESQQALVADLRAGNRRLQQQWAGCPAAASVPGDAETQPSADDAADLRAASAGRIARAGDDADIQVRGLQAYARACASLTRDEE